MSSSYQYSSELFSSSNFEVDNNEPYFSSAVVSERNYSSQFNNGFESLRQTSDVYETNVYEPNTYEPYSYSNTQENTVNQIAQDLLQYGTGSNREFVDNNNYSNLNQININVTNTSNNTISFNENNFTSNASNAPVQNGNVVSAVETAIINSISPIPITNGEEITVDGVTGLWANKDEVLTWKAQIPISVGDYLINRDDNPEIITKKSQRLIEYNQEIAIRYLRPPTPPAPGEIIISQLPNRILPPAPPIVIRQMPPRPATPEPLVIREAPPQPPPQVGRKVITVSGKKIPPPPRKVVIERLAPLPNKPQAVFIERWLPYSQVKRRVIFQKSNQVDPVVIKPRNVVIQWDTPQVQIRKEFKYLGVIRANPVDYVQRFGSTLKLSNQLPQFVLDIKTPDGLVLAAEHRYNLVHELEGDVDALKLIDLEREGLAEYRNYVQRTTFDQTFAPSNQYPIPSTVSSAFSLVEQAAQVEPQSFANTVEYIKNERISNIDDFMRPLNENRVETESVLKPINYFNPQARINPIQQVTPGVNFMPNPNQYIRPPSANFFDPKLTPPPDQVLRPINYFNMYRPVLNPTLQSQQQLPTSSTLSSSFKLESPNSITSSSFAGSTDFRQSQDFGGYSPVATGFQRMTPGSFSSMIDDNLRTVQLYEGRLNNPDAERLLITLNNKWGNRYDPAQVKAFLSSLDFTNSGSVDLDEFKRALYDVIFSAL